MTGAIEPAIPGPIWPTADIGRDTAEHERSVHADDSGANAAARAKTILVVEDHPDLRELLCHLLQTDGYRAVGVEHGQGALEYLSSGAADLIILDLMMPVMDGWEFRRRQQADPRLAQIPVIVLTALGRPPRDDALGSVRYFKKPVDFDELLDVIREMCS